MEASQSLPIVPTGRSGPHLLDEGILDAERSLYVEDELPRIIETHLGTPRMSDTDGLYAEVAQMIHQEITENVWAPTFATAIRIVDEIAMELGDLTHLDPITRGRLFREAAAWRAQRRRFQL